MKKALIIIGGTILLLALLRGWLYRQIINYNPIGTRTEIRITNQKLLNKIDQQVSDKSLQLI